MTNLLENRIALVTGGSRGIGRAIVNRFRVEGATVVTCGRGDRPDELNPEIKWHRTDVSSSRDVQILSEFVQTRFGKLDILVNNAGAQQERNIVDSTDDDWDLVMGVNARGVYLCSREFIPMMTTGGGVIVNIGSISGNHADSGMAIYNASKGFVHSLTRSIAVDHGRDGIRCNTICPGWIMTDMADAAFDLAGDPDAARNDALARHPVGRFGHPEDIAAAAAWLASNESSFVTGQSLTVDGGLVAASPLRPEMF
jgi:meso-butanediol dehydrogenase/(S,S)-butanediol dehydrogenase/diacetyl reductase